MNKRMKIIITIVILITLSVIGLLIVKNNMDESKFNDLNKTGFTLMEAGKYKEAIQTFEDANSIYDKSDQAIINLANVYYNLEDFDQALVKIQAAIEFDPENNTIKEYLLSSDIYMMQSRADKAVTSLKSANKLSNDDIALEHLNLISIDKFDRYNLFTYLNIYNKMTNGDKTLTRLNLLIEENPNNPLLFYVKAVNLLSNNPYEAIDPLEKALELDNQPIFYSTLLAAYYNSKRMFECQDLALDIIDNHYDLYEAKHFLALTYISFSEYEKALLILEKLIETYDDGIHTNYFTKDDLKASLVEVYLKVGNDQKSKEYINQYVKQNSNTDDRIAEYTKTLEEKESMKDDVSYIRNLFEENYMYESNLQILDGLSGDLSDEEVSELINNIKKDDDLFTNVLFGEYYNYDIISESGYEYRDLGNNVHYINFEIFTTTVAYDFIKTIDNIDNSINSKLIIDLRDNLGGRLSSAASILDNLTGETTLFSQVSESNYDVNFESNSMKIDFEEIYVLVNNLSASASEIMALSLNENLDNVTIIGEQTYGKGVGQNIFDDIENERTYYIVSFYLNVGDINIHNIGLTPEVLVESEAIDSYITELLNLTDF